MGYFKNLLNLKNVIVGNRASIDEIKDLKKQTASKILQGNSLLGLDVIAYDSNYNRLNTSDATTIFLYEELKKNNSFKQNIYPSNAPLSNFMPDETIIDTNPVSIIFLFKFKMIFTQFISFIKININNKFLHQPTNANQASMRTSPTFCLKLSLENLIPSQNCAYSDENSLLCVNIFLFKENSFESYYLW